MAKTRAPSGDVQQEVNPARDIEDASTDRQIALAKSFAGTKGWTIVADYVDGASQVGPHQADRSSQALPRCREGQFDVVIVRDSDRLSRDDEETDPVVMLRDCDVQVWEYTTGQMIDVSGHYGASGPATSTAIVAPHTRSRFRRTPASRRRRRPQRVGLRRKVYGYRNVAKRRHVGARSTRHRPGGTPDLRVECRRVGLLGIAKLLNKEGVVNGDWTASSGLLEGWQVLGDHGHPRDAAT
jgi:hypothetical protein